MLGGSVSGSRSSSSPVQQKEKKPIQTAELTGVNFPKSCWDRVTLFDLKTLLPSLTWRVWACRRHDIGVGALSCDPAEENRSRLSERICVWDSRASNSSGYAQS
jgi:hypothetical protein